MGRLLSFSQGGTFGVRRRQTTIFVCLLAAKKENSDRHEDFI